MKWSLDPTAGERLATFVNQLGARIRELRMRQNWTQVEAADILGLDRSYLSEIENGKKDPSFGVLKTLAVGFHLTLSDLLRDSRTPQN